MDSNCSTRSSTFSHRFSVSRSSKNLRLRRSRSTFVNHLSTPRGPRDLHVRSGTFCSSSLRQARDSYSNSSSSTVSSPLPQDIHIQSWMYWARQGDCHAAAEGKTERYTKVYAVLRNEFLLLYRHDYCPSKDLRPQPLVQIAVASSSCSEDGILHVEDPFGQDMELHLYERRDFEICRRWSDALEQAAELTHSYFSTFDVNVDDLSRGSVYRGTLHDIRVGRESSLRTSVTQMSKLGNWSSLRRFIPDRISRYSTKRSASSILKDTEV